MFATSNKKIADKEKRYVFQECQTALAILLKEMPLIPLLIKVRSGAIAYKDTKADSLNLNKVDPVSV